MPTISFKNKRHECAAPKNDEQVSLTPEPQSIAVDDYDEFVVADVSNDLGSVKEIEINSISGTEPLFGVEPAPEQNADKSPTSSVPAHEGIEGSPESKSFHDPEISSNQTVKENVADFIPPKKELSSHQQVRFNSQITTRTTLQQKTTAIKPPAKG